MKVLVMNPCARRLKSQKTREALARCFYRYTEENCVVICVHGKQEMLDVLEKICQNNPVSELFISGGDGTFRDVMDWVIKHGKSGEIQLAYLGGGEFCYMRKFFGLSSADPVKNLRQICSRRLNPDKRIWRPVQVEDTATQHVRYCSVFGNGVVYDVIRWYEEKGKGSILSVLWLIFSSIFCILSERLRVWHGRFKTTHGHIAMDGVRTGAQEYFSIVVGAVPEFMMWCRPFQGTTQGHEVSTILYWGSFLKLAFSVVWVYFGRSTPWIVREIFNAPVERVLIETSDVRVFMDGDTIDWPQQDLNGQKVVSHRFEVGRGPEVHLLIYI